MESLTLTQDGKSGEAGEHPGKTLEQKQLVNPNEITQEQIDAELEKHQLLNEQTQRFAAEIAPRALAAEQDPRAAFPSWNR